MNDVPFMASGEDPDGSPSWTWTWSLLRNVTGLQWDEDQQHPRLDLPASLTGLPIALDHHNAVAHETEMEQYEFEQWMNDP